MPTLGSEPNRARSIYERPMNHTMTTPENKMRVSTANPLNWPCGRCSIPLAFLLLLAAGLLAQVDAKHGTAADPKIESLLRKMTLEKKVDMLSGETLFSSHGVPRLHIPSFWMSDGPVGAHVPPPSTAYAAGIGLAATWDPELAQQIGVQLGRDARSRGAHFLLGPGVNIYRAPMNGRNFEYFGEDPYLGSRIAIGYIHGLQS
jgi:beta-glucosidase